MAEASGSGQPEAKNAVAKAIVVLQALRRIADGASARQLSTQIGLPRSTVQRLLSTLAESGMVIQDAATQTYRIGPQALLIGLGYRRGLDLVSLARPQLLRARDQLGETVGLSVRVGDSRVFIDEAQSLQPLRFASELGRQYPLWSGASGRILLLGLTSDELSEVLADESYRAAVFRAVDVDDRSELLQAARRDGYAVARNETIENVSSVAVPILDPAGRVAAALSVSGPTPRLDDERIERARAVLTAAATEISRGLG
ncbi:IclR family transcriptional regulator [Microlunatus soli]|uniref:DNA-binding transcriptional regulator, IclR family n=1 Tax=Microlunatus soli TaxID=630515 RepID=A0A1H2A7R0_9ACTN|nr:IclR family transcriptional regulator [Microlunatus soli]SDT41913.1 DNA-binding transcriptional regulator, IclR family [Microlunatus soli]